MLLSVSLTAGGQLSPRDQPQGGCGQPRATESEGSLGPQTTGLCFSRCQGPARTRADRWL